MTAIGTTNKGSILITLLEAIEAARFLLFFSKEKIFIQWPFGTTLKKSRFGMWNRSNPRTIFLRIQDTARRLLSPITRFFWVQLRMRMYRSRSTIGFLRNGWILSWVILRQFLPLK